MVTRDAITCIDYNVGSDEVEYFNNKKSSSDD